MAEVQARLADSQARVSAAACVTQPDGTTTQAEVAETDPHFPASLVKLFHAVAFLRSVQACSLEETAEDGRALEALLKLSSNDADQYLVRRLCPPPPENGHPPPDWFVTARTELSDAWTAIDPVAYCGLRIGNATYEDGPFGLEAATRRALGQNRMTARAGLAILRTIAGEDQVLAPSAAARLRGWLDRRWARPPQPPAGTAGQVSGFLAATMPGDVAIWSKGGWTETTRHDALCATMPDGRQLLLVVLITGAALLHRDDLLPAFAGVVLEGPTFAS